MKCAMRGPRSRAGLIAKPVVPPKERPIEMINNPTTSGLSPSVNLFAPMVRSPRIKTAVPIISLIRLLNVERIAACKKRQAFRQGHRNRPMWVVM